jgi:hypothetical protein
MYSLVPSPYGLHGRFGAEPQSPASYLRVKRMSPLFQSGQLPLEQRKLIIVISRGDRGARRLTNHKELLHSLRTAFATEEVLEFVGTKQGIAEAKKYFMRAKLVGLCIYRM